ncbi:MAG: acyl-CoA dehydrogenase family protein [Acidimicrobiia bacterium]|nr:acyl-CoA dehydrogenase family protein [Acidimicrobiia bacterium]
MPDFDLTPDQEAFRAVVRDFAEAEIRPRAEQMDATGEFPVDIVRGMGELGLLGLPFPEEVGGGGADYLTYIVALEEIARVDQSTAITLEAGVSLGAAPIVYWGTEAQRERWLPPLLTGDGLAAFGLTEPDAGSDAGATRTTAVRDGDEWVVNGSKAFITNSGTEITVLVTIAAVTSRGDDGRARISNIVVPSGTPGFVVEPKYAKMGWRASDTHGLTFEDCRVPVENLLGEEGDGFRNFLRILDEGRIAIAALGVGLAQACLEESVRYANTRTAFGRPIGANQGISFKLADMAVSVEAARMLTRKAAWLRDLGRPFKQAAAMAKLYASEAAVAATREATQVFGGAGFIDETPVSRYYRDAKVLEIGEGTSEIQRLIIAGGLLADPGSA